MTLSANVRQAGKRNSSPVANASKITIRRNVLEVIDPQRARVFDAYAGDGHLYREVWHLAAKCVGCDLKFYLDDRVAFVADNRRVLRNIDLAAFNLFDLDAYGSPWEQLHIIAARRKLLPGETVGLVLTEGQGMKMKMGGMSHALATLAGVRLRMPGLGTGRVQGDIINRGLQRVATLMGGKITKRWDAVGKTGSAMHYIGLVLTAPAD